MVSRLMIFLDEETDTLGNELTALRTQPVPKAQPEHDVQEALAESSASSSDSDSNFDIEQSLHESELAKYKAAKLVSDKATKALIHFADEADNGNASRAKTSCRASPLRKTADFGSASDMSGFAQLTGKLMCDECLKTWPVDMV